MMSDKGIAGVIASSTQVRLTSNRIWRKLAIVLLIFSIAFVVTVWILTDDYHTGTGYFSLAEEYPNADPTLDCEKEKCNDVFSARPLKTRMNLNLSAYTR